MLHLNQRLLSPTPFLKTERATFKYESERSSIGQRILQEDDRAEPFPDAVFQRLDSVVQQVESEVTVGPVNTIDDARAVLESIERVVTSMNFVCPIPYYLVHSFSEGLRLIYIVRWFPVIQNILHRKKYLTWCNLISYIQHHSQHAIRYEKPDISNSPLWYDGEESQEYIS